MSTNNFNTGVNNMQVNIENIGKYKGFKTVETLEVRKLFSLHTIFEECPGILFGIICFKKEIMQKIEGKNHHDQNQFSAIFPLSILYVQVVRPFCVVIVGEGRNMGIEEFTK